MTPADDDSAPDAQAEGGDQSALADVFERERPRLERMVELRLHPRVRGRLGAQDILQDTFLEASRRFDDFLARRPFATIFLWLRFLAMQRVHQEHRRHFGPHRDVAREIALHQAPNANASSAALAARLVGHFTSPSQAAARAEAKEKLQCAIDSMKPLDREILALRHYEGLTSTEAAQILELEEDTARKRYLRALRRLGELLEDDTADQQ